MLLKCKPSLPGASSKAGEQRRERAPRVQAQNKHTRAQCTIAHNQQLEDNSCKKKIQINSSTFCWLSCSLNFFYFFSSLNKHPSQLAKLIPTCTTSSSTPAFVHAWLLLYIAIATPHLTSFSHTFLFGEHSGARLAGVMVFICNKNKTGHSVPINNHYHNFSPASSPALRLLRVWWFILSRCNIMTHMTEKLTNGNTAQGAVAQLLARNIDLMLEIESAHEATVRLHSRKSTSLYFN